MMKILMINDSQTCVCFTVPGARYEIHQFWVCVSRVSVSLASHNLLNSVALEELLGNLESLNGIESLQFF